MRKVWLFARREYLERVRTRSFLLSTILFPALVGALIVLPTCMVRMRRGAPRRLVIASSPELGPEIEGRILAEKTLGGSGYQITLEDHPDERLHASLDERLSRGDIDGFLWAPEEAFASGGVVYTARETSDLWEIALLDRALSEGRLRRRLLESGIPQDQADSILRPLKVSVVRLERGRKTRTSSEVVLAMTFVMVMLLFTTMAMYGVSVMRSVVEEKSSRVIEVILAAATPKQLMAGKLLGVGSVGLTQLAIWGMAAALVSVPGFLVSANLGVAIPLRALAFMPGFFVLGYLLYSAGFAALGASVNSEQEAQQLTMLVMSPLILSVSMIWSVLRSPDSTLAIVFSLFPFTAPLLMFVRLLVGNPPLWQLVLSVLLMVGAVYGTVAVCARIYRVGVLMYGKRPTLPELLRWLKYS